MFPSTSLLSLGCGMDPNAPISDAVAVDSFVNLHGIGAMQVGEIRAVRANAWAGTAGQFNFLDDHGPELPRFPYNCSTNIAVYRADQTHWYASTSIDRIDGITGANFAAPILDATLNEVLPGDTAQLNDTTTLAFKGNYSMPFGMTIYCPSCTSAPPTCGVGPCVIPQ